MSEIGDKQQNNTENKRRMHPHSLNNLGLRWKNGQSGNPNGRPKKDVSITSLLKVKMLEDAGKGKTHGELIVEALLEIAESRLSRGQIPAIKEILERVDGKVATPVDLGNRDDKPLLLQFVPAKRITEGSTHAL